MTSLAVLREELGLYPAPRLADGQPAWTLHDPVKNQFFQLDWPSFEILSRWHLRQPAEIATAVSQDTTLALAEADVLRLQDFLQQNQLLQQPAGQARELAARLQRQRGSVWTWLLHHYLFFRVPLLRADPLLGWLAPRLSALFSRRFLGLTLIVGLLGLAGVLRNAEAYAGTLVDLFSWQGLAAYGLTLAAVKLAHELSHGLMAKRFGCRVPTMGVALMVLWPVAYTDTTEVWKLPRARQRLAVAGAGIGAELVIAAWATAAWLWLPEGGLKTAAFLLSSTTWISTLLVNASPFMRFDGYFLLSDAVNMPNLHARAFALARWQLREMLFGLGEPAPEAFSRRKTLALVAFAWGTWLYRLGLFLGVALLVYHFFVKAVGIALFGIELVWFIAAPVASELKAWWARRERIHPRRGLLLAVPLLALVLLFVLPLPGRVTGMGLLQPAEQLTLYAPAGARVTALPHRHGDAVRQGEPLFAIESPALQLRALQAQARAASVQGLAAASAFDAQQRRDWQLAAEQMQATQAEARTVSADAQRYAPTAPFTGRFYDLDPDLHVGDWVAQNEVLGRLVATGPRQVVTYADEQEVRRLAVGDEGLFIVDPLRGPALQLKVRSIERDAARTLNEKLLASPLGGQLPVRQQGEVFYPETALYRVTLDVAGGIDEPEQSWRGLVSIHARAEPLAKRIARHVLSVFWREAGF
ncbi:MAG TPA: HlyD family efflux transporter periplasmic adaptor subunit [Ideonella sp.]|uniref:HlyD family efflux transporter periplasmic adaptor subunit n=1 Tax=Ideonella sp. TaxID=1929293 RepID=UPI002BE87DD3|nr:HlyD family efflux transporter periplasmic adaptor subunit [Ideonella sp.]HSI52305.1 HlyD family efflux transporter periplasmic adaptor subunit [Ideonella sp.]